MHYAWGCRRAVYHFISGIAEKDVCVISMISVAIPRSVSRTVIKSAMTLASRTESAELFAKMFY